MPKFDIGDDYGIISRMLASVLKPMAHVASLAVRGDVN